MARELGSLFLTSQVSRADLCDKPHPFDPALKPHLRGVPHFDFADEQSPSLRQNFRNSKTTLNGCFVAKIWNVTHIPLTHLKPHKWGTPIIRPKPFLVKLVKSVRSTAP